MNSYEYKRLLELKRLIDNDEASNAEEKEYMTILYNNGNITKEQYDKFLEGEGSDNIIGAGLVIGGVLLAGWLLGKLFEKQ